MLSKLRASRSFAGQGLQKITGSDMDEKDRIIAGVQFSVCYIGSTEVADMNGTGSSNTEKPVAEVYDQQKRNDRRKGMKMVLTISSRNLTANDETYGKLVASFPISNIVFC